MSSLLGLEARVFSPQIFQELLGHPMTGLRNVHHTVIRRTRSPSHPCGSIMAGVRG
jgi:hypothetical protein